MLTLLIAGSVLSAVTLTLVVDLHYRIRRIETLIEPEDRLEVRGFEIDPDEEYEEELEV